MTAPNAALAYAVLDHIDAHPESWDQGVWWCGSSGCFAGWTCTLSGETPIEGGYDLDRVPNGTTVPERAAQLLGFADREELDLAGEAAGKPDWLFCSDNSREDLGEYVEAIFGPRPTGDTCPDPDCRHAASLHQAHGCVGHHGLCRCTWRTDGGEGGSVTGGAS